MMISYFEGGLAKKRGVTFLRGVHTLMPTMLLLAKSPESDIVILSKPPPRYSKMCSVVTDNPLSAKFIKWSNTLKILSVFDHFSGLALKGLRQIKFNLK